MIKFLISRPIAVSMTFLAFVIVGLVSMKVIPISMMPDIDIPQITVKITCPNAGAREVEESYVSRMRSQLQQTGHLDELSSTASNGKATIILRFKYGTNINYANLEVNEKVDAMMSYLPDDFERPKVIKSKASDIPAFHVNVALKQVEGDTEERFLELSDFTESVIKRRIEQLGEVALVDISGLVHPEIYIRLNTAVTQQLGVSEKEVSQLLKANDVSIGNIKVKDGAYEYNLRYSSAIVERTDLEELLIEAGGRVFKLKDIAEIGVRHQNTQGQFLQGGQQALTMAVIKKSDVQMYQLQSSFASLLTELQKDYTRVNITLTRDQSAMLDVSISNLRNTLILGGVLAFIIVFLFLKDPKAPWLIGLTIPVSVIMSILIFFLSGLSINIISLSGLVLGVGMMIDNAIIVIDNIDQHFKTKPIYEACVAGTNEIVRPLLSSVLTTCAVFLPLIFLSGVAGELFFDQAIAVTVGLCVSFIVSITLLPVYYRLLHRNSTSSTPTKTQKWSVFSEIENLYGKGYDVLMKRKVIFMTCVSLFTLLGLYLFFTSPKEAFPAFEDTDVLTHIEWNENINIEEAELRIATLVKHMDYKVHDFSAYIGVQQFILSHLDDIEEAEVIIYYKAESPQALNVFKTVLQQQLANDYPLAQLSYKAPPNVFSQIFAEDGALLEVNYVSDNKWTVISPQVAKANIKALRHDIGVGVQALGLQSFLVIKPNTQLMVQYGISAPQLYSRLRQALDGYEVATLKSGASYTPIVLSDQEHSIQEVLASLYIPGRGEAHYPVRELVTLEKALDYKEILGGKEGAYVRVIPELADEDVTYYVDAIKMKHQPEQGTFFLSGQFFKNQHLFWEMLIVLSISILLLYFILAAQFESLKQPLIVLLEIPIDIAGAILVLKLGGGTVNIMSMIGIVVMSGIIINDSILKIDTINRIRKDGADIDTAIHRAGMRRLKPIVMTSITTILALMPFLFGNSMGNVLQRPLALAIIGGMTVGTFISLYFIPMMYQWVEREKP